MKVLVFALILISTTAASAVDLMSVSDVAVMQQAEDGSFHVVCTNGNREKVSALDLELGNVCPNKTKSHPSGILSVQQRSDGLFDVVCKDMTRTIADTAAIMAGDVCPIPQPTEPVLTNGNYKVQSGYTGWCPQAIAAETSDDKLIVVNVTFLSPCGGHTVTMSCENLKCSGISGSYTYSIIVNSSDEYVFDSTSHNSPGTFKLIK